MITEIEIDEQIVKVTPEMIWEGSFECQTCTVQGFEAVFVAGTIYWDCENGHRSEVVVYE